MMTGLQHGGSAPRRVAVLRALQLGDLLCAVPASRALRASRLRTEIVLVSLPWALAFVRRFQEYVDGIIEFPGYPGLPERDPNVAALPMFFEQIRRRRFDLAIQIHGCGTITNPLVEQFGARLTAVLFQRGEACPDSARFLPYSDRGLEIDRLLSLVEFLGIPPYGSHLEFPLSDEDRRGLEGLPKFHDLIPGTFVCVHVGASTPSRRWPLENLVAVARHLAVQGLSIVLTGSGGESGLSHALHVEARPHRVKVTAVIAGGMRTPFLLECFPDLDQAVLLDPRMWPRRSDSS
jgi:ADP-heptose:LPS heptosyltransferase